jgi:hypothetical protein
MPACLPFRQTWDWWGSNSEQHGRCLAALTHSSWLASLFYFGYLICEYPTTLLSQMFPIGKFVGAAIFVSCQVPTLAHGRSGEVS